MKRHTFLDLAVVNAPYIDRMQQAASRVIAGGRYIGGDEVTSFEQELATSCGATEAVGVSNGLDGLRLIFRAYIEMGVMREGDEVIVPSNTYIASILAVTDNRLTPVFVEPDAKTLNLDTSLIERAISERTRAILVVHLYGRTCWDQRLVEVARRHNLKIVEDNAQAIGAHTTHPGLTGAHITGALGDAAAFSFYPTKNIGAIGDAGAVTTSDSQLANAVRALRNYGSDRQYHNIYEGLNCRLDPIQAAMLRVKLPYIDEENAYRASIAAVYESTISNPEIIKPLYTTDGSMVWHQYIVRTRYREQFRQYMDDNGVKTAIHYPTPPHLQPCYERFAGLWLPVAERISREVVSLPITRCTNADDAAEIAEIINKFTPHQ